MHDISDYLYLVDKVHYDPEEKCENKSTRVNEEGEYIVVYRRIRLNCGNWATRKSHLPIFAKDV